MMPYGFNKPCETPLRSLLKPTKNHLFRHVLPTIMHVARIEIHQKHRTCVGTILKIAY